MPFVVANDCGIWEFFKFIFETTKEGYSPVEKITFKKKSKASFCQNFVLPRSTLKIFDDR